MKILSLLSVTLLLVVSVARTTNDASLKAKPNPLVLAAGQTEGTSILTWDGEGAQGFLWVSVDGEEETKLTDAGSSEGSLEVTIDLGKTYAFRLYTIDKEKLLASVSISVVRREGEPPPSRLPPIAPPGRNVYPAYIYAVSSDGTLKWYRHDGAEEGRSTWQGPRDVATGWDKYKFVFPGGGNIIYAVTQDGILQWYRHRGFETGLGTEVSDSWEGPNDVGRGWGDLKQIFSGGDGIIYGIKRDGKLVWFRHNTFLSGAGLESPGTWEGPKEVGRGWENLKEVFSTGSGVIYAVTQNGKLQWYKHNAYLTGRGLETAGSWQDHVELGAWDIGFQHLFSSGGGIIYDIERNGTLTWSRHLSYDVGVFGKSFLPPEAFGNLGGNRNWQGPLKVGNAWAGFTHVFALLPNTNASGGVLPVDNRSRSNNETGPGAHPTINPQPPRSPTIRRVKP